MKLTALTKKLRAKTEAKKRFQNNTLYRCNKRAFFSQLRSGTCERKVIDDPPTKEDISTFWGNLWSNKGPHKSNAKWLEDEKNGNEINTRRQMGRYHGRNTHLHHKEAIQLESTRYRPGTKLLAEAPRGTPPRTC